MKILFLPEAATQYEHLEAPGLREKIDHLMDSLILDPARGKSLQGPLAGHYVCELGDYRVVYGVDMQKEIVTIERIAVLSSASRKE